MCKIEKNEIFISYSRKDIDIVNKICMALDVARISYFIDKEGISGAIGFSKRLAESIVNSTLFLFIASKNAYASKYTTKEVHYAIKEKPSETILPYIIDEAKFPIDLDLMFADINWRTLKEHPIETVLIDDLLKLLGRERVVKKKNQNHLEHNS